MDKILLKYNITPRVLKADTVSTVSVKGVDESTLLYDDVDYVVTISAKDDWKYKKDTEFVLDDRDIYTTINCRAKDGVISFEHLFTGEHEWKINIKRVEDEKHVSAFHKKMWPHMFNDFFKGFEFSVYSLYEDLYEKMPFKGDLHMHTIGSDGLESARLTAAQYRKWGFDYISITDHMLMEPSLEAIEEYKEIPTDLKIFPGEEVHQQFPRGSFHMVNFNGKRSVNEILRNEPERAELEMEKIAETIDLNNEEDRKELAWFKWVYDEIKKAGGIAIYPHPFWVIIDALNIRTSTSKEIYKRGYTDVYEILGGTCDKEHNRMQVQMYYDMCSKGVNLPIVAATDSHSAINHGEKQFDQVWTITFSENAEKIPENILKGYSTAVDNYVVTDKNVYGDLRLVNYTWFLLQNYYEMHDELCFSAGQAIVRYVLGDKTQKDLIAALENEIKKFNDGFFGRR